MLGLIRALLAFFGFSRKAESQAHKPVSNPQSIEDYWVDLTHQDLDDLPYRLRDDFLSRGEYSFYQVLKHVASNRLTICPKVSLSDLFYVPSRDSTTWRTYTNKIDRKHVDFVLCDPATMTPRVAIELDDKSHSRADRKERDEFVDAVFAAAQLAILHVPARHAYQPQELATLLSPYLRLAQTQEQLVVGTASSPENGNHAESPNQTPTCPKCGAPMILRTARTGNGNRFWGCTSYPRCRFVLPLEEAVVPQL